MEDAEKAERSRVAAQVEVRRAFEAWRLDVEQDPNLSTAKKLLAIQRGRRDRDRMLRDPGLRMAVDAAPPQPPAGLAEMLRERLAGVPGVVIEADEVGA